MRASKPAVSAVAWVSALWVAACATSGVRPDHGPLGPLDLPASEAAQLDPALLARVRSSPMGYFRLVNVAFENEVCKLYSSDRDAMRVVNLHGDAHLEQYSITDTGRGLTDFDDAASGPAVVDLVRFTTSLVLASRERHWEDHSERILDRFLTGYLKALRDPTLRAKEPAIVRRMRAHFPSDPEGYFRWLNTLLEPVSPQTTDELDTALHSYIEGAISERPDLPPEYFQVQVLGRLNLGIGSARLSKYIARMRGATDSPADDEVIELKEMADLTGVTCLARSAVLDPTRVIVAQARLAYEPYRFVGYLIFQGKPYGVHAWSRSYHELSIEDLHDAGELADVAADVGMQLGLGHPKFIATPYDRELRESGVRFLEAHADELKRLAYTLADEVTQAWSRLCKHAPAP